MSSIAGFAPHAASSDNTPPPPASPKSAIDPLANEQTFLKLLVSQLKNQNPLNPTDGTEFVSQLTSYSQLEQLIGIRQNTTPPDPTDPTTGQPTRAKEPNQMSTAFSNALSGLTANSLSHRRGQRNLANLSTTGYKANSVSFQDLVNQSLGGVVGHSTTATVGGSTVAQATRSFTQGSIQSTSQPFDAAIQGNGFFVVRKHPGRNRLHPGRQFQGGLIRKSSHPKRPVRPGLECARREPDHKRGDRKH